MFMRTYASYRVKRKSFYRKSELHIFLLISGGHIGGPKRYKGARNVLANHSETVSHKDLRLGQIVYILVFYNISFSWLLSLDGFQFIFLSRDGENDLLFQCVRNNPHSAQFRKAKLVKAIAVNVLIPEVWQLIIRHSVRLII